MTETSGFWTTSGTPSGHQVANYTQAIWSVAAEILAACSGFEGVAPGYLNEYACSDGGANTVDVANGGGVSDGKWHKSDSVENVNIPSAVGGGNTRIDRVVIRVTWANFEAEIHRIAGTDAADPSIPAITQTSGTTYDIMLCQALVNTGGDITATDERVWAVPQVDNSTIETNVGQIRVKDEGIGAVKIINRTRKFHVPVTASKNTTDTLEPLESNIQGLEMVDAKNCFAYGYFVVPQDFVSDMKIKAVISPGASGNLYALNHAYYGSCGEAYDSNDDSNGFDTEAVTLQEIECVRELTLTAEAIDDRVIIFLNRDAANASDTINSVVYMRGWVVEYTADS